MASRYRASLQQQLDQLVNGSLHACAVTCVGASSRKETLHTLQWCWYCCTVTQANSIGQHCHFDHFSVYTYMCTNSLSQTQNMLQHSNMDDICTSTRTARAVCKHQITEVQQTDALRLLQTEHQITGGATNRCTEATTNRTPDHRRCNKQMH